MKLDKLKSIAYKVRIVDSKDLEQFGELTSALHAAIKVIEVLSAANEFYAHSNGLIDNELIGDFLVAGKRARQARQDAEEIMKGG